MTDTPLSPEIQAALAQLHDIRLPDPVGWWPLAPGWWVLIVLALAAAAALIWREIRRRRSVGYAALRELAALRRHIASSNDPHPIAVDLAVLVRRVALRRDDGPVLAAMSGEAWANRLSAGPSGLSAPVANFLADAPYTPAARRQDPEVELPMLQRAADEAELWIRGQT